MNVESAASENLKIYMNTNLLTTLCLFGLNIFNFKCFYNTFDGIIMNRDFSVFKDVLISGFYKFKENIIELNFE